MSAPTAETGRIRSYYAAHTWRASGGRSMLVDERRAVVEALLSARGPLTAMRVCDVGCGGGSDLARWAALGVPGENLFGTELVPERATTARSSVPEASILTVDGFDIPWPDASFDLVTANLVLSSVLDPAGRRSLLTEMRRVTRRGGLVAVYDFAVRKPWNRGVVAMSGREVAAALGPPDEVHRLGPFLPLLDPVLRLPHPMRDRALALLPRTHRMWIWSVKP